MRGEVAMKVKPWPQGVYKCNGDYRKESFLEEHIGGPLYENQKQLPRLPIPPLKETINRFLPTALPLAKTEAEALALKRACDSFPEEADMLQQKLRARRGKEMKDSSWLQLWWNQLGYLHVRDPIVVNVSYFFSFIDDPTVKASGTMPNIQRGAAILFAAAKYRKKVITGRLQPGRVGRKKNILCSTAYKYMFNACRIPLQGQDSYWIYDPSMYTHFVVARKGHFFSAELVDQFGEPLSLPELEKQLERCIAIADAAPSSRPKFGLLTSRNRDDWASDRVQLVECGGRKMVQALEKLQSGALLLNLDDEAPVSRQECGNLFWTGGLNSGENRWFDKSIQVIVCNNGKAGLVAEHSMMDGMPVVGLADALCKMTYALAREQSDVSLNGKGRVFDIFESAIHGAKGSVVRKLERNAWVQFHRLVTSRTLHAQSFQAYGSKVIKSSGFPPDAYVQVAMQLATYRLFGEQVGTYEATQVRSYLHGRTDVTRAVSSSSAAFVKKMGLRPKFDESIPVVRREKLELLRRAATAHARYTSLAAKAFGVDRHFFGLAMMAKQFDEVPVLFSDPVFLRSKKWRSSTSQLSHPRFNLWGYGEVVEDGVGLAYSIQPESCVFCITARASTAWTDKLSELLEEALLEMRRLFAEQDMSRSKL